MVWDRFSSRNRATGATQRINQGLAISSGGTACVGTSSLWYRYPVITAFPGLVSTCLVHAGYLFFFFFFLVILFFSDCPTEALRKLAFPFPFFPG